MLCKEDIRVYLQGVKFKKKGDTGPGVDFCDFDPESKLTKKLFNDEVFIHDFDAAKAEITKEVEKQCVKAISKGKKGWIDCVGKCWDVLHKYSRKELESTAFILRLLAKSMIDINKTQEQVDSGDDGKEVTVIYEGSDDFSELTGKWMRKEGVIKKTRKPEDLKYFTIDIVQKNPRLVMALGPSSAGKTFSGKTVMKMIKEANEDFPTKFLSIDGGIYREESIVYQTVLKALQRYPDIIGFTDLVSPSFWEELKHKTIFSAGTAKGEIGKWLDKKNIRISLYVPETLGAPDMPGKRPFSKIKKYRDIIGDSNWIGLLIWQHLNDAEISKKKKDKIGKWKVMCDFPDGQKCKGTVPLGKKREESEGKMYSSGAWLNSMVNGEKMLKKAKGLRVDLHNSGQSAHKSTIREYPLDDRSYVFNKELADKNNMVYHKSEELPEESESGPETEAPLADYPQILMVKRGPENASGPVDMYVSRNAGEAVGAVEAAGASVSAAKSSDLKSTLPEGKGSMKYAPGGISFVSGGKRTRKRKKKRRRTKKKRRRKRKKRTKRRKKRTRRR